MTEQSEITKAAARVASAHILDPFQRSIWEQGWMAGVEPLSHNNYNEAMRQARTQRDGARRRAEQAEMDRDTIIDVLREAAPGFEGHTTSPEALRDIGDQVGEAEARRQAEWIAEEPAATPSAAPKGEPG